MINNVPFTSRLDDSNEAHEKRMEKLSNRIRVSIPGIIQAFDANTQLVTVKPAIREMLSFNGKPFEHISLPDLMMVPIILPRAGDFIVTMPVSIGDECLVIFGDMCYDTWWENGQVGNQIDLRRHDLSDGFAILGPWSKPREISNYSTDSVQIRNEDKSSYVEIKNDTINIITTSEVNVEAPTVNVSSETVNITADDVNVEADSVAINAETAEVTATSVNIDGSTVTIGSATTIDDKLFLTHTHTGVQTGAGVTGGVS